MEYYKLVKKITYILQISAFDELMYPVLFLLFKYNLLNYKRNRV
ncbi:MAG: hypothetical protein Q7S03_04375 [bacterium]|nr:hypothetical protein [bacterium]